MIRARITLVLFFSIALMIVVMGCNRDQSANPRSDSQVASDITNKINSDANLPNKQISVGTSNGVVTLSGTVGSEGERMAAANDASQVEGVKTVVNNLVVSPAANGMAEGTPSSTHRATASRGTGNRIRTAPMPTSNEPAQSSAPMAA